MEKSDAKVFLSKLEGRKCNGKKMTPRRIFIITQVRVERRRSKYYSQIGHMCGYIPANFGPGNLSHNFTRILRPKGGKAIDQPVVSE